MASDRGQENARNPTRELLLEDIHGKLTSAEEYARKGKPRQALLQKDAADVLWLFGVGHGFLEEEDRVRFYGDRHLRGGKETHIPGIFPDEMEAKCRKIVDFDDVGQEVVRRVSNILDRALTVISSREDRMAVKKIFDDIPRE